MAQASARPSEAQGAGRRSQQGAGKPKPKPKPSYKHIPHSQKPPHLVAKRNARERRRVQAVNQAFYKLRKCVPIENRNKRVSKVKTLQRAIDYIRKLERILEQDEPADAQTIVQLAELASSADQAARHPNQRKQRQSGRPAAKDCDLAAPDQPRAQRKPRRSPKGPPPSTAALPAQLGPPASAEPPACSQEPADYLLDGQPAEPYFVYPPDHAPYGYYQSSQEQLYLQQQQQQPQAAQVSQWPESSARHFSVGEAAYAQHFYSSPSDYSLQLDSSVYSQPPLVGPASNHLQQQQQQQLAQPNAARAQQLNDSGHSSSTPLNSSLASGESPRAANLLQSPSSSSSTCSSSSGASSSSSALAADLAASATLCSSGKPSANTRNRQVNSAGHYLAYADSSSHLSFAANYQPASKATAGHLTDRYGLQQYQHSLQHQEQLLSQYQPLHMASVAATASQSRPTNSNQVSSTTSSSSSSMQTIQEYTNKSGALPL